MINICLFEPEMPSNTGNIGRTCLLTGSRLHLIRPFPFKLDDKSLKRAGMDYWKDVDLVIHDSLKDFLEYIGEARLFFATTKANNYYHEVEYVDGDYIIFGSESCGLPAELIESKPQNCIKIPMIASSSRSLNLANSVSIILYEALRQNKFTNLK